MSSDPKSLFSIIDLESGKEAALGENSFLRRATLRLRKKSDDSRIRSSEVVGFALRPELLKIGKPMLMTAESLLTPGEGRREVVTSPICSLEKIDEDTYEFETESGSLYRILYGASN